MAEAEWPKRFRCVDKIVLVLRSNWFHIGAVCATTRVYVCTHVPVAVRLGHFIKRSFFALKLDIRLEYKFEKMAYVWTISDSGDETRTTVKLKKKN